MSSGSGGDGATFRSLETHARRAVGLAELDEFGRLDLCEQRLGFITETLDWLEADRRDEKAVEDCVGELLDLLDRFTQYDAGATPMSNTFTKEAQISEFTALTPAIDLNAKNTGKTAFSKESGRMNFKAYDLAPEDELNRILWAVARPGEPHPTPIHRAIFVKPVEGR